MFDLPLIVPQDLALRCGMDNYGENDVQINARIELLKRIRQLELALDRVWGGVGHTVESLYPQVRSPDPDKWTQITVTEAAKILVPNRPLDFLTRFAVHKHLMNRPKEFVADTIAYRSSQMFYVRPKSRLDRLDKVIQFVHNANGPVEAFVPRARKVIIENRRRAKQSWAESHSEHPRDGEVFTPDDATIIDFLCDSLSTTRKIQTNPYAVNVSKIVKSVGLYHGEVNESQTRQLLVDLGAIAPWQDIGTRDWVLGFEQEPEETSPTVAAQNAIVEKARTKLATTSAVTGEVLGPEDFYTHDLLESVRHDFGNIPVYVIDDANAEELDDGISIETIPSEPDCAWIHAHIADPTAVLPPTHVFAQSALKKVHTSYFAHRTWPMFPRSLTRTLLHSVGDMTADGKPERVLSFSFKVDGTGDIVDYKVRAGIIRNVRRATYDIVDLVLGQVPYQPRYPFGGQPKYEPPAINLNDQQQADIRALKAVVDRMYQRTLQLPVFSLREEIANIQISPKPLYTNPMNPLKPPIFRGFPSMSYSISTFASLCHGARLIVTQVMTGASRVASRWALDHGVPLLRRSSSQPMSMSDDDFSDVLARKDEYGMVAEELVLAKKLVFQSVQYTLQPSIHWPLGIPDGEGYCRVTSPLRRYADMVSHWQIKHALLHPDSSIPLFSPEWLQDYGVETLTREKMYRRAELNYNHWWALCFIKRWMENPSRQNGPDPLAQMVGYIKRPPAFDVVKNATQVKVTIPELGLNGFLVELKADEGMIDLGLEYDLKVREIQLGVKGQLLVESKR